MYASTIKKERKTVINHAFVPKTPLRPPKIKVKAIIIGFNLSGRLFSSSTLLMKKRSENNVINAKQEYMILYINYPSSKFAPDN